MNQAKYKPFHPPNEGFELHIALEALLTGGLAVKDCSQPGAVEEAGFYPNNGKNVLVPVSFRELAAPDLGGGGKVVTALHSSVNKMAERGRLHKTIPIPFGMFCCKAPSPSLPAATM